MIGRAEGDLLLGIDLGTTGAKVGVLDREGRVLGSAFAAYETATPRPGWAEQEPHDWWDACSLATRRALDGSGVEPSRVAGVGVSGQMHGSVFLDSRREVVRPCILWCDQRTASQCRRITELVGTDRLSGWVANPALAGFTAPKVLWLSDNEPENYSRVSTLLLPKDYINMRLTGSISTEVSDASGTLLFDVARREWSREMIETLGVPEGWLPKVLESGEVVGKVTREASEATGLAAGTPVAAGGADNACGAIGMGVIAPGSVAVSIGSSGTVLAPVDRPLVDPAMRLHSFCHAVPGTWYIMGVMLSAGLSLRWFATELGEPERAIAAERGIDPYELLEGTAAEAPPGSDGLVFLPYLTGERTPHADPDARGVLFGLDLTKKRAHVVRSIMEGVVFGLADSIAILRELGVPLHSVIAGGGGSRSSLWRQIQADVFGIPLRSAGEIDSAMLGAALLGGEAAGLFESARIAVERAVSPGEETPPDPSTGEAYRRSYRRYRALYPALRELFPEG